MNNTETLLTRDGAEHSRFGLLSLAIGILNIFIIGYYVSLLLFWFMEYPDIANDPTKISGMPLPDSVAIKIIILLVSELAGMISGVVGLFERGKRKLFSIIGITLNSLFFLLTASKLSWDAWGKMGLGLMKMMTG